MTRPEPKTMADVAPRLALALAQAQAERLEREQARERFLAAWLAFGTALRTLMADLGRVAAGAMRALEPAGLLMAPEPESEEPPPCSR